MKDSTWLDLWYATKPMGWSESHIDLDLFDFRNSQFVGIRHGIRVLGSKISNALQSFEMQADRFEFLRQIVGALVVRFDLSWARFANQEVVGCDFSEAVIKSFWLL